MWGADTEPHQLHNTRSALHSSHIYSTCRNGIHTYVRVHVCMYVCMYVRTYVRVYVCMYVCMYICMYVFMTVWWEWWEWYNYIHSCFMNSYCSPLTPSRMPSSLPRQSLTCHCSPSIWTGTQKRPTAHTCKQRVVYFGYRHPAVACEVIDNTNHIHFEQGVH